MGSQKSTKLGVKSTALKQNNTRHPFEAAPATREVEGSQSYRARMLGEPSENIARVPEEKVWSTRRRNRRLDGSGNGKL